MIIERLTSRLQDWEAQSLRRHRQASPADPSDQERIFCSNDYLGLAHHPRLKQAMVLAVETAGVGSGASQMVVGHHYFHQQAEEAFADFFGFDKALLFSTGYMANVGVIQALVGRGDCVYQDRLNHASLIDGVRLSGAKSKRYRHCDARHLQMLLKDSDCRNQLLVTDAVFSMEGDQAPLRDLTELRKQHDLALMVDDAHGVGVVGPNGKGSLAASGMIADDVDILVCPLGKAFGAFGAMVMGKAGVVEALQQFSRSYMYTTAMPAALARVAFTSLQLLQQESWRVERLQELIDYFRQKMAFFGESLLSSATAIQSVLVGDSQAAIALSNKLKRANFQVMPIRYPTVPTGKARLRFTLNVGQTEEDIDQLSQVLQS